MTKEEWSEDDLDDDMEAVVPMPQVISNGGGASAAETHYRANAYNERMMRARQASKKTGSSGMVQNNAERPTSARNGMGRAAPIDVLTREVEEMEIAEQQRQEQQQQQQRSQQQPKKVSQAQAPAARHQDDDDSEEDELPMAGAMAAPEPDDSDEELTLPLPPPPGPGGLPGLPAAPTSVREMPPAVIDTSDLKSFLMRPGPQGAMVQCYIQRKKTGLARLYPTYEVYLKDGEQFLLAARRRKKQKQSNYKVSLDKDDLSRHSSNYFGKLKSNFMGTEFQMYDDGCNPEKLSEAQKDGSRSQVRQELATVLYKQNVLGSRGPRKMKVMVPNVGEDGKRVVLRPTTMEDTMLERYRAAQHDDDIQILRNKQPKWNDQVGAYVLNFNGRVTRASVKNFQLCNVAKDPDHVVMQFGRVGKDAFTMDYQWPLCGLQAFGIALSSFDYKIACE